MRHFQRITGIALLAVLLALALGCGDSSKGTAELRVVHASPDAPNVDVYFNNNKILTDVPYETASAYLPETPGSANVQVDPTGTTTAVINSNETLVASQYYTAFAIGPVSSISLLVTQDDNTPPPSGQVEVRIVHGSPSAGPVDVYVTAPGADLATTTPTLTNVPFEAVSAYLTVPAGSYEIRVTPTGTKTVAIDSGAVALAAGQIRTVVALDAPGGGTPLTAIILDDLN
jgi:hypothetical protein